MGSKRMRLVLWCLFVAAMIAVSTLYWIGLERINYKPDFTLQDESGQIYRMVDFRGKYSLVFFGFTNCPNICSMTMSKVAHVMDDLRENASNVQPLFISIDPERDKNKDLSEYLTAFHPPILGLVGDNATTQAALKSSKVDVLKENDPSTPSGNTLLHSSGLYLIGPDGEWLRNFTYETPVSEILADVLARL